MKIKRTAKSVQADLKEARNNYLRLTGQAEQIRKDLSENEATLREYGIDTDGDIREQVEALKEELEKYGRHLNETIELL